MSVTATALTNVRGSNRRLETLARAIDSRASLVPRLLLGILLAVGFLPFALSAVRAAAEHQVFLGVSGVFPFDQDQYLAYAASAPFGVIRNLYGTTGARVFVDPVWSPTGVVEGLTHLSPAWIMAFWNLVGGLVLYAGAWRLVRRFLPADQPWRRNVALLLSLFGGMTMVVTAGLSSSAWVYATAGVDLVPAQTVWGYAPIAIAVGLMPFAAEGMELIVAGRASARTAIMTAAACLLSGWLHPWQGVTLLLIGVGLVAGRRVHHHESRMRFWQVTLVGAALAAGPMYFKVLAELDHSWAVFSRADQSGFSLAPGYLIFALLPNGFFAAAGALRLRKRAAEVSWLLLWPLAVLVLVAVHPPEVYHSFDGLALPLGVLSVCAWPSSARTRAMRTWRLICGLALLFQLVSIIIYTASLTNFTQGQWRAPLERVRPSDIAAVTIAKAHAAGTPVLTTQQLGVAVPVVSATATWAGDEFWTPNAKQRALDVDRLMLGESSAPSARQFVRSTGAKTVLEPCGWTYDLSPDLRPMGFRMIGVGCAKVYWRR